MNPEITKIVEASQIKSRPEVRVGDTVKLHMRISESGKERIQIFEGVVIAMSGIGVNRTLTVRKISMGIGVERIVPLHSTTLTKIEVVKRGNNVRRSKLYYMRDRIGKKAMKVRGGTAEVYMTDEVAAPVVAEDAAAEDAPVEDSAE